MSAETKRTVVRSQQLSLHAEDGVDDLLLLARHGEEAVASAGVVVEGERVAVDEEKGSCAEDNPDRIARDKYMYGHALLAPVQRLGAAGIPAWCCAGLRVGASCGEELKKMAARNTAGMTTGPGRKHHFVNLTLHAVPRP